MMRWPPNVFAPFTARRIPPRGRGPTSGSAKPPGSGAKADRLSGKRTRAERTLREVALAIVCIGLVFAVFYWRPLGRGNPTVHPAVGQPANFLEVYPVAAAQAAPASFPETEIKPLTIQDLPGRVTLIVFWGPWMQTSVDALRLLAAQLPLLSRPDLQLVAVAYPPPPDLQDVATFPSDLEQTWREMGLACPVYVDPQAVTRTRFLILCGREKEASGEVPRALVLPTCVVVDRAGIIRAVWEGWVPHQEREVADQIEAILGPRLSRPGR